MIDAECLFFGVLEMKDHNSNKPFIEQNSFLKGLLIGIGSTVLIAGIGAAIVYQFINLKKNRPQVDEKLYDFSSQGGITSDTDVTASSNPRFRRESEKLEKDYEIRLKEFEEIEEAAKHFRDRI
jgi:hypothetical protein